MNEELKLSIFANLQSFKSKGVGMDEVIRLIKHDEIIRQKTVAYRQMAKVISREEANKHVKVERMEAFSVGVLFNGSGKQPEHIVKFTGLAMCDIDKVDHSPLTVDRYDADGDILGKVKRLIMADPHTLMCYETISKKGLRVIYRYERSTFNGQRSTLSGVSWRAAFLCGNEYYKQLTGFDYDSACSNYGRLSGLAHDPDVYYNPDAEPFIITDDMILEANLSKDSECDKAHKEYEPGTQSATAKAAWTKVKRMLDKRGLAYEPHHRHDYILHACYLLNRFGVAEDDLRSWAESQWSDIDSQERNAIITHCYAKGRDEHGIWRVGREYQENRKKSHENTMITIAEIRQWLSGHVELIYNVVTDQTMIGYIEQSTFSIEHYYVVDDRVLASLRSQIAVDTDKRVLKSDVYDVIKSDFASLIHPVREYFEDLPLWDGVDRVAELAAHVHTEALLPGQTDEDVQSDLRWALHKWLCAAVGTWLDDDVCNHEVLTLIGPQGIYKTTFFRYLLPPELRAYFWENSHNTFSTKDDHLALAENCFVNIEEVEATGQRELSELKSLITSDTVKERRPYARFRESRHRLASFCATGNQQRFLTDETGNRRWLCFKVKHIDDPRSWNLDYKQLYTQLRDDFLIGFRYWFDSEDEQHVERLNVPFRVESDEEQLILMRLRIPREGEPDKLMNAAMVCQLLNGGHVGYPLSSRKVSVAMVKMGFETVHTRKGNFFRVFEIPYDQIQSTLSVDAYDAIHEEPRKPDYPEEPELAL